MLAFDIETYAAWDELRPGLRDYLVGRDQARGIAPEEGRAVAQRASLLPGVAQVIAIGLWGAEDGDERLVLSLEPGLEGAARDEGHRRLFGREDELLRAFWDHAAAAVARGRRLVSFNGRAFDGPVLTLRSAVLGVEPRVSLVGPAPTLRPHTDLVDLLTFGGARRERYSFAYWCHVFGVESPKHSMDGAEVGPAFERGERAGIARYALEDARATGQLYQRLAATLIPLAEEGWA